MLTVTRSHVLSIFKSFKKHYGNAWASLYDTDEEMNDAVEVWYSRLKKFELFAVRKAFKRALEQYREFPPNVGQFEELCYPTRDELGLSEDYAAYKLAASGNWECDVIWNAVQDVGQYDIKVYPEAKRYFIKQYQKYCDMVRKGEELPHKRPEPMQQLSAPVPEHVKPYEGMKPEECIEHLRKLTSKIASS